MSTDEIERLLAEVDTLYAYQPYAVTKSIIERVKMALKELQLRRPPELQGGMRPHEYGASIQALANENEELLEACKAALDIFEQGTIAPAMHDSPAIYQRLLDVIANAERRS